VTTFIASGTRPSVEHPQVSLLHGDLKVLSTWCSWADCAAFRFLSNEGFRLGLTAVTGCQSKPCGVSAHVVHAQRVTLLNSSGSNGGWGHGAVEWSTGYRHSRMVSAFP